MPELSPSTSTAATRILTESLYLPPITHVAQLLRYDEIQIEQYSHYQKASYRNRAHIGTSHGALLLSIPLAKGKNGHQAMRDVRISYNWDWQKLHWQSLYTAYRSSPYFEYYEADFYPYYQRRYEFLLDFNRALLDVVLGLLRHRAIINTTDRYIDHYDTVQLFDARPQSKAKDHRPIDIGTENEEMPYRQVFADRIGFVPDLSIVDLLFNMGNKTAAYLSVLSV